MENTNTKGELDRLKELKQDKQYWHSLFQLVGEYIHMRKQDFETSSVPGEFLTKNIFDSHGPKSARKAAAAIHGMIWQNAKASIMVTPPRGIDESKSIKEYFDEFNSVLTEAMDDPKAGLSIALEEILYDMVTFGSAGLGSFKGTDSALLFQSYGVDEVCFDEGINGYVDTVYRVFEWPLRKIVKKFGEDNLSDALKEKIKAEKLGEKVKILHVVEPRENIKEGKLNNLNMPIKSKYIEIDSAHLLKESGFEEMPISMGRFYKKKNEVLGRSPAMDSLPDVMELNATREGRLLAREKNLDPPLGVYDDAVAGGGIIDTSSGGISVVKAKSRLAGGAPIFPLIPPGNTLEADKAIEELKMSINEHFLIDRLLDFNNNVQMTLGEVNLRNQLRAESVGSILSRIIVEVLTPTIERCVSVLFRDKRLGGTAEFEIPKEIAEKIAAGEEFYQVKYLTPAARIMKAEEANGITRAWEFAGQLAQMKPDILDMLNAEESLEQITKISGAPASIIKSTEEVEMIREARARQQQEQAQMEQAQQVAETAKTAGEAEQALGGQDVA